MANTIITKNSATASAVPSAGSLVQGELAVNVTDKKLYTKNASGTVVEIGGGAAPQVGDVMFGTTAPTSGTWLEAGKYYSKATYPTLAAQIGNVPDGGVATANTVTRAPFQGQVTASQNTVFRPLIASNGAGTIVSINCNSNASRVYYSTDNGVTFNVASTYVGAAANCVSFANGLFFISVSGNFLVSSNGVDWSLSGPTPVQPVLGVVYVNGRYVTAANDRFTAYSFDGYTWTPVFNPQIGTTSNVAAINGVAYAYGGSSCICRSTDGVTFTKVNFSNTYNKMIEVPGAILAVTASAVAVSTDNGLTFVNRLSGSIQSIAANSTRVVVSGSGRYWWANVSDLTVWTQVLDSYANGGSLVWDDVNNQFVSGNLGQMAYQTSSDGLSWTTNILPPGNGAATTVTKAGPVFITNGSRNWRIAAGGALVEVGESFLVSMTGATNDTNFNCARPVAFGNGVYVGLHQTSQDVQRIYRSTDAINWTPVFVGLPISNPASGWGSIPQHVVFANGTFIVTTSSNSFWHSTDGLNWTIVDAGASMRNAIYAHGVFILVGASGNIRSGADLNSLTTRTSGTTSALYGIATNGTRTIVTAGTALLSTTDGTTWTTVSGPTAITWQNVRYFPTSGLFIAVGNSGNVSRSTDGVTWVNAVPTSASSYTLYDIAYDGGSTYVTTGTSGRYFTTTNAFTTWTSLTDAAYLSDASNTAKQIEWVTDRFVAMSISSGATVITSPDGLIWTRSAKGARGTPNLTAIANGLCFTAGPGGMMVGFDRGLAWSETSISSMGLLSGYRRFYKFGSIYYGCSTAGLYRSTDGITYTKILSISAGVAAIAFSGSLYVAAAYSTEQASSVTSGVYVSTDGINFSQATSIGGATAGVSGGGATQIFDLVYANGNFIAAITPNNSYGAFSNIFTSADGLSWTPRGSGRRSTDGTLVNMASNGTIAVYSWFNGFLQSSDGGVSWQPLVGAASNPSLGSAIFWCDGVWVAVTTSYIYTSVDLQSWASVAGIANNINNYSGTSASFLRDGDYLIGVFANAVVTVDLRTNVGFTSPIRGKFNATPQNSNTAAVRRGDTMIYTAAGSVANSAIGVIELPLYSYDTGTTFFIPPRTSKAFVYAGA